MIITASEAEKKTRNNINNCTKKGLIEIMEQIDKAIEDCKFSISSDGYLKSETKQMLEKLGYKVEIGSQYNKAYYIVSW